MSQSLIRDRLKVDYNFAYTTGKGSYADKFIMRQAVLRNPTEPIYETSGNNPQYGKYFFSPGIDYHNPVAMLEQRDDEGIRKEFSGSVNASLRIIDGLKISAMGAIIERSERYGHYYGRYYPVNIGNNGTAETYNDHYKNKMLEATIDYSGTFGDHKLQAIAGYSFSEESSESYDQMNYKFDTDIFGFHNIGSGGALKEGLASMGSSKEDNRLIAFFGRVMYNYKEKYLFSASVRYEGSSRFGDNHKWGTFPAVSLGWRISREPWLKDAKWLNELKLRAGFGITGNQEIGNYRSLSILRKGSSNFYYNKKWISTYEPGSNPNPDLRWEKKKEFNVGLDMSVLDNRLNVTVDYYNRRTKDLLYTYTVPVPPNLYPSKFANVGTIDNKGIEVTVNATPISRKNFSWNLAATISHNKNNLVKFSNEDYEMVQIQTGYFPDDLKMYTMRIVEGGSLGNFWGPKFVGFNDNGGAIYEDLDGGHYRSGLPGYRQRISRRAAFAAEYLQLQTVEPELPAAQFHRQRRPEPEPCLLRRVRLLRHPQYSALDTRPCQLQGRRILFVAVRGGRFLSQTRQHHAELRFQAQIEGHLQAALLCHGTEPLYHHRLQGHRPRSQHLGPATRHRLV